MLLKVKIAEGSPFNVVVCEALQLDEELICLHIDGLDVLRVQFRHILEDLSPCILATNTSELERSANEGRDLSVVVGFELFEGRSELDSLVAVD